MASRSRLHLPARLAAAVAVGALASGCGGGLQDSTSLSRSLGGDIGSGYNASIAATRGISNQPNAGLGRGVYPRIETSFQLSDVKGDPYDFEKTNVQVTLKQPDGATVDVPCFFDGGTTWRMRFTPSAPGQYAVASVKLNHVIAHEDKLERKDWNVTGEPLPGFVRIERGDHTRFVFDNGVHYFPIGHNQAWRSDKGPDIPEMFGKMHDAGENWSRVWMTHWDGKNLDWRAAGKQIKPGDIDLEAAKRWDSIVDAAQKDNIYFQMVIQHHGQYSSKDGYKYSGNVNPNWEDNPYNAKNGGFLQSPESFFINPEARALTKRKLYYILARWGYSPNIMAFELFNEVEGTDAGKGKMWDDIALWHREMALFLRQYDGYRHLLTTSSAPSIAPESPIWETVDYLQTHAYPSDVITALGSAEAPKGKKIDKPWFVGEFGASGLKDSEGTALHGGLWASIMRGDGGAAQYWDWDSVERNNLYSHFKAATAFMTASGLAAQKNLVSVTLPVRTSQKADLRFGPGGGFAAATQSEFVVGETGTPPGMDRYPAYLQGANHRDMMPKPLTFQVSYAQPGKFAVTVREVSKAGGKLKISVDGKSVERDFPAGDKDHAPAAGAASLTADVPAGAHAIAVENAGTDWIAIRDFSFSDYAPALEARARMSKEYAAAWIYHRSQWDAPKDAHLTPASGRIVLTGLQPGKYRATWWDTREGKSIDASEMNVTKDKESPTVATPPIERDVALYVTRATTPREKVAKRSHKGPQSVYAPAASESATGPANDARGAGTAAAAARPGANGAGQASTGAAGAAQPPASASPGQPFTGRP
ncbi:MAG TPA: DUF5060 domain-containing protein [Chthonomonadaceae bacterium]|nr:DUF5060 domain-containing protein [Chthonomonadaceae bacterium]